MSDNITDLDSRRPPVDVEMNPQEEGLSLKITIPPEQPVDLENLRRAVLGLGGAVFFGSCIIAASILIVGLF